MNLYGLNHYSLITEKRKQTDLIEEIYGRGKGSGTCIGYW
jgi:hypothetical protein